MKIKSETFIRVEGWMVTELGLKGNELLLYAMIRGYTKDNGRFTGSRPYIAEWLGCSIISVDKLIKALIDKKLIVKEQVRVDDIVRNQYRACIKDAGQGTAQSDGQSTGKEFLPGSQNILPVSQNTLPVSQNTLPVSQNTLPVSQNTLQHRLSNFTDPVKKFDTPRKDSLPNIEKDKEIYIELDNTRARRKSKERNGGTRTDGMYDSLDWDVFLKNAVSKSMGDDL
ncbi:MAG: helix-turn-helix domain-containing protein [Clostridia bacterium]|nr:helix-turn-helix domain-containing protein [Clostridia bacterium]